MKCSQSERLALLQRDGVLRDSDRVKLQRHTDSCASCRQFESDCNETHGILAPALEVPVDAGLEARIASRVRAELGIAGEPNRRLRSINPLILAGSTALVLATLLIVVVGWGVVHGSHYVGPARPNHARPDVASRRQPNTATNAVAVREAPVPTATRSNTGGPTNPSAGAQAPRQLASTARTSLDDLRYMNLEAPSALARWSAEGSDEAAVWKAAIDRTIREGDSFVDVPFPKIAGRGDAPLRAAVAAYRQEKAVIDPRVARHITLSVKGMALGDVCDLIAAQTNVSIKAKRDIADEKVTIFCEDLPARDVMRAINRVFGYGWQRDGADNAWTYALEQSLSGRLAEEELRSKDLNQALIALDQAMAKRAAEEEARKGQVGGRSGQLSLYQRLSPADRAALRNGERLEFSTDSPDPDRAIPPDVTHEILHDIGPFSVSASGNLATRGDGTPLADVRGAVAKVQFHVAHVELGELTLQEGSGFRYPMPDGTMTGMGSEHGPGNPMATARAASDEHPDNAVLNARLKTLPQMTPRVSVKAQSSCPIFKREGAPPEPDRGDLEEQTQYRSLPPMPHVTSADVWEAIHQATKMPIVADYYTHLYNAGLFQIADASTFDAMCRCADNMGTHWSKQDNFILGRSASFMWDKLKEVPNSVISRLKQHRAVKGYLDFDDLLTMCQLRDEQLNSKFVSQFVRHCADIPEWGLVTSNTGGWGNFYEMRRSILRALSHVEGSVRSVIQSPEGIAFNALPQQVQSEIMKDSEEIMLPQHLLGARIKVEYVPPGAYVYRPRGALITSGDAEARIPVLQGKTSEEVFAAARKFDPEAQPNGIVRSNGVLAISVTDPASKDWVWSFGKPESAR